MAAAIHECEFRDILSAVFAHAEHDPTRLCVRTFSHRTKQEERTFADVAVAAGHAAAFLHKHGLRKGDIIVLTGTHHIDFYAAWLGCVWLGAIPTVLAEPSVRIAKEIYWARLSELLHRIDAWGLLADPRLKVDSTLLETPHFYRYDELANHIAVPPDRLRPSPDEILLLQHSSGTTGLQKGVMLSQGAVWHHATTYGRAIGLNPNDVVASWLPLYHDMGFIACFVDGLLSGVPMIWLSPFEWVANPALLLEAISQHRATLTWLPNFAFAFLAQRVKTQPGTFDLSSLRAAINCSEPVTAEAMDAFAARFTQDGFSAAALHTCYAMAENVFAVSTSTDHDRSRRRRISRSTWHDQHVAAFVADSTPDENVVSHVSNGRAVSGCEVRIVEDAGTSLPACHAGKVLIRSPFLFDGYFRRDDLNGQLLSADGYYDTGDLGYLDDDGHVYITGRARDLVIVGGKNIYPQDVEQVTGEVPGVYPGRVVCFGVALPSTGTEGLVVLLESEESADRWPEIAHGIRGTVPSRLDLDLVDVRVVARGELRKSTAGKLARSGNREWYLGGRFGAIPPEISTKE